MTTQFDMTALMLGITTAAALVVVTGYVYMPRVTLLVRRRIASWKIRKCTSFEYLSCGVVRCNCGSIATVDTVFEETRRFEISYASCPLWKALKAGEVSQMRLLPP